MPVTLARVSQSNDRIADTTRSLGRHAYSSPPCFFVFTVRKNTAVVSGRLVQTIQCANKQGKIYESGLVRES